MNKRFLIVKIIIGITLVGIGISYAYSEEDDAPINWERTVAFISDARPDLNNNLTILSDDFNQTIPQSPLGRVDAVVMIGDMNPLSRTEASYKNSTLKNKPRYFVMGNHEFEIQNDLLYARSAFTNYSNYPNPGPAGTRNTTYSFDVKNLVWTDNQYKIHIISLDEYWNGKTATCNPPWYIPPSGLNASDGCFKYGSGIDGGGYIPDPELFNWLKNDLNNTNNDSIYYSWNIVVGHERQ